MTALMTVAMMVAMMLPSIAPTLWRYHRDLRAARMPRAGQRTTLFGAGYVKRVDRHRAWRCSRRAPRWPRAVLPVGGRLGRSLRRRTSTVTMESAAPAPLSPRLSSSRPARNATTPWRDGCRLGVDCGLSCAAPMAVLFVAGLMDRASDDGDHSGDHRRACRSGRRAHRAADRHARSSHWVGHVHVGNRRSHGARPVRTCSQPFSRHALRLCIVEPRVDVYRSLRG